MVLNQYFQKEIVMSKDQFLDYYNVKYGKKEIKLSKRLKTMLVFVFANLIWINKALGKAINTASLDKVGYTMLGIVRSFAYWVLLILCLMEIIKTIMSGDTKGIGKIIIKYLLGYGALFFMPYLFDVVREAFK